MIDACRFNPAIKAGKPGYAFLGSEYQFNPTGRSDGKVSPEARLILRDLKKNPESVATLSQLDAPLKPLKQKPPVYPSALKKEQPAGSAEVEFFVDTDGKVQLPRITASTTPEFGYAVAQAVTSWRFEVPRRDGKPVVVRVSIPIDFAGKTPAGTQP
jgi:TonB family protein